MVDFLISLLYKLLKMFLIILNQEKGVSEVFVAWRIINYDLNMINAFKSALVNLACSYYTCFFVLINLASF